MDKFLRDTGEFFLNQIAGMDPRSMPGELRDTGEFLKEAFVDRPFTFGVDKPDPLGSKILGDYRNFGDFLDALAQPAYSQLPAAVQNIPQTSILPTSLADPILEDLPYPGITGPLLGLRTSEQEAEDFAKNKLSSEMANETIKELVTRGMSFDEAIVALGASYNIRPFGSQLAAGFVDPLAGFDIAQLGRRGLQAGLRGARGLTPTGQLPGEALIRGTRASAATDLPGDLLDTLLAAPNHGAAVSVVRQMSDEEVAKALESLGTELAPNTRGGQAIDRARRVLQSRIAEAPTVAPPDPPAPTGTTADQMGLGVGFEPTAEQGAFLDVGRSQEAVPLIDADPIIAQRAAEAEIEAQRLAGQRGMDLFGEPPVPAVAITPPPRAAAASRSLEASVIPKRPEDAATITRIGPEAVAILENGVKRLNANSVLDNEIKLEMLGAHSARDTARLKILGEQQADLSRARREILASIDAELETLGIARQPRAGKQPTEGVSGLWDNLVADAKDTWEDFWEDFSEAAIRADVEAGRVQEFTRPSPTAVPSPPAAAVPSPADLPIMEPFPRGGPLRFDPQTNLYNGEELVPGSLLKDDAGTTYKVDRRLGFILTLDELNPDGSFARTVSYSVDRSDTSRYKALYKAEEAPTLVAPIPLVEAAPPVGAVPQVGDKQSVGQRGSMTTVRAVETVDPNVRYELYIADKGQPDHMVRVIDADTGESVSSKTYSVDQWSSMQVTREFHSEVSRARGVSAPSPAAVEDIPPQILELSNKWATAKSRNSANAAADLNRLKESGFEVQDADAALTEYKTTMRADFDDTESFSEARTEAWDNFVNTLGDIERVEIEGIPPATPPAAAVEPAAIPELVPDELPLTNDALLEAGQHPDEVLQAEFDLDRAQTFLEVTKAPGQGNMAPLFGTRESADFMADRTRGLNKNTRIKEARARVREAKQRLKDAKANVGKVSGLRDLDIGDLSRVMGQDTELADMAEIAGVRYELHASPDLSEDRGIVRIFNKDSGEIVGTQQWTDYNSAMDLWEDSVQQAFGGRPLKESLAADFPGMDTPPAGAPASTAGVGGPAAPSGPPPVPPINTSDSGEYISDALAWFRRFLSDPARASEWSLTVEWRRRVLYERQAAYDKRVNDLVATGMDTGEAFAQARQDTLSGSLPTASTAITTSIADVIKGALFDYLYAFDFKGRGFDRIATAKALENALTTWPNKGKAIPDSAKVRARGGITAMMRLQHVFGDDIAAGLNQGKSIEDVIGPNVVDPSSGLPTSGRTRRRPTGDAAAFPRGFPSDRPSLRDPIQESMIPDLPSATDFSNFVKGLPPGTLKELEKFAMKAWSDAVTAKPNWYTALSNPEIIQIGRLRGKDFIEKIAEVRGRGAFVRDADFPAPGFGTISERSFPSGIPFRFQDIDILDPLQKPLISDLPSKTDWDSFVRGLPEGPIRELETHALRVWSDAVTAKPNWYTALSNADIREVGSLKGEALINKVAELRGRGAFVRDADFPRTVFGGLVESPFPGLEINLLEAPTIPLALDLPSKTDWDSFIKGLPPGILKDLEYFAIKVWTDAATTRPRWWNDLTEAEMKQIGRLKGKDLIDKVAEVRGRGAFVRDADFPAPGFGELLESPFPGLEINLLEEPTIPLALDQPIPWRPFPDKEAVDRTQTWWENHVTFVERINRNGLDWMKIWAEGLGLTVYDAGNLLRANQSSVDGSWLRQNMALLSGNIPQLVDGWKMFFKAAISETVALQADRLRMETTLYKNYYERLGLDFLRPLDQKSFNESFKNTSRYQAEEFPGRGGTRPIQRLTNWLPWVRISGRAHISALNEMNWKILEKAYESMLEHNKLVGMGKKSGRYHVVFLKAKKLPLKEGQLMPDYERASRLPRIRYKEAERFNMMEELDAIGRGLEDMSGRARLGPLRSLGPGINSMFFAFRLSLGRVLTPTHLFRGTSRSRKEAWKNVSTTISTFAGVLLLGKHLGIWDVELDRRSADFMKIRIGKLRIDPWGGYQQFVTFMARLLPGPPLVPVELGGSKSTVTGEVRTPNQIMHFGSLVRSKFSPMAALLWDYTDGKNFIGEKVDPKDWEQWMDRSLQFSINDIREMYMEESWKGALKATPGLIGAGTLVYDLPRWPELDGYYQIRTDEDAEPRWDPRFGPGGEPPKTAALRRQYRKDNPEADAKLFVRGDVKTLRDPSASKPIVMRIMIENRVNEKDVPGWKNEFKGITVPKESQPGPAPRQMAPRQTAPPRQVQPTPGRDRTAPVSLSWDTVSVGIDWDTRMGLVALWLPRTGNRPKPLTEAQKSKLRPIFERFPMGASNFETWYSRELRSLFDQDK